MGLGEGAIAVLGALPRAASAADLPLVLLRPRASDPDTAYAPGDYDLLVDPRRRAELLALLAAGCAEHTVSWSLDSSNPHKLRLILHEPRRDAAIVLECWERVELRDPAGRHASSIPYAALAPHLGGPDGDGWRRLSPLVEILLYWSHLHSRRKDPAAAQVRQRLAEYRSLAASAAPELLDLFSALDAGTGVAELASRANERLAALGILAPCRGPAARLARSWRVARERRCRRRRRRALSAARLIAVTGADGVGKGTLIEALLGALAGRRCRYRFKNLFRHHPCYGLVSRCHRARLTQEAGGELAKNLFDELCVTAMARLARSAQWWLRLRTRLCGRHLVDRYHHDLLFTGLRGTGPTPGLRADWRRACDRLPLPDWHLHLDAPDEVILARKAELSAEALAAYRAGMLAVIARRPAPGLTCLDTRASVAELLCCLRQAAARFDCRLAWREQR